MIEGYYCGRVMELLAFRTIHTASVRAFLTVAVGDIVVGQVWVGAAPGEVGRRLRGRYHGGRAGERVPRRPRGGSAVDELPVRLDAGGVGEARGGAAPGVGGHGEEEVVGEERLVGLDVVGKKGTCRKKRIKLVVDLIISYC